MKLISWAGLFCLVSATLGTAIGDRGRGEEPKARKWPRIDQTQYAGSQKCAECHKVYYDGWKLYFP